MMDDAAVGRDAWWRFALERMGAGLLAGTIALAGCGGSSASASATDELADVPFSELSDADAVRVCEELVTQVRAAQVEDRVKAVTCEVLSALTQPNQASCETARAACASGEQLPEGADSIIQLSGNVGNVDCQAESPVPRSCPLSVSVIADCTDQSIVQLDAIEGLVTCADAGNVAALGQIDVSLLQPSASCAQISSQCAE